VKIIYKEIDKEIEEQIIEIWGDWVRTYGCIHHGEDCYSLAALIDGVPVGFISTYRLQLPQPLNMYYDAFIDDIEVTEKYRRKGIASKLIALTEVWAKKHGSYQVRAWSSDDNVEAISMWHALSYGICPAIMRGESVIDEFVGKPIHGFYVSKVLSLTGM